MNHQETLKHKEKLVISFFNFKKCEYHLTNYNDEMFIEIIQNGSDFLVSINKNNNVKVKTFEGEIIKIEKSN